MHELYNITLILVIYNFIIKSINLIRIKILQNNYYDQVKISTPKHCALLKANRKGIFFFQK